MEVHILKCNVEMDTILEICNNIKLTFPTFYTRLKTMLYDEMMECSIVSPSLFKIYPMLPKKSLQHIL